MTGIRPPTRCGLYTPGHSPHWIQARLAREDAEPPIPGSVVEVRDDGTVVIEVGATSIELWNHDPGRLRDTLARGGRRVLYQPRWRLLTLGADRFGYLFCVATPGEEHRECPTTAPTGTAVELLRDAGGFSVTLRPLDEESS